MAAAARSALVLQVHAPEGYGVMEERDLADVRALLIKALQQPGPPRRIGGLSLHRNGFLELACEDEASMKWVRDLLQGVRFRGLIQGTACLRVVSPEDRPPVRVYAVRIPIPNVREDPDMALAIIRRQNPGLAAPGAMRVRSITGVFEGGAFLRIEVDEPLIPALRALDCRPWLVAERVLFTGSRAPSQSES